MSRGRVTAQFVRRALDLFRDEAPAHYATVAERLRDAPGRYRVGVERFTMIAANGVVEVSDEWGATDVAVRAEIAPRAILELVDGTVTLEQLLAREVLVIRASADALLALSAAVRAFVEGAILSRAMQLHFERYRAWVLESAAARHPHRIV